LTDGEIIQKLRGGDSGALAAIMDAYNKLLWFIAGGILKGVGTEEDIEECICDVYFELWRNPAGFDDKRGALKTYLAVMARSRALDRCRALAKSGCAELSEELPDIGEDLEDRFISRELQRDVRVLVEELGEPDREILIRRYFFGEKPGEISQKTRIPVKEVKNRLYQSKLRLRSALDKRETAYEF
jgi:RNA polymerase sigma-70 factor (ECF subfamily)